MIISLDMYQTLFAAVCVLMLGRFLKARIGFLEKFCIPAPVIGGVLFAVFTCLCYVTGIAEFEFDDILKEVCMVFFFTSVGFQANLKVLKSGGKSLIIFLGLVVALILCQNFLAVGLADLLGISPLIGLCTGSIPMVGGHGTAGAFGPVLEDFGVAGATTLCTAAATYGLIAGSVMGGPTGRLLIERRKLLDTMICQLRPNYEAALTEYQRLLEQKSALLREYFDAPGFLDVLPEYNARMAQVGALVISYRARYLRSLEEAAAAYHAEFSGGAEKLTLQYRTVSSVDDPFASPDVLREQLRAHQQSHERAELDSRQCLSGPHKDDFEAALNGLPVGAFGSQGQTRTAAISIKLAERELLRRDTGEEPVLLLDDVLSELDAGRQDFVLNQLKTGQVFITCCETDRLTKLGQVLTVRNGEIGG